VCDTTIIGLILSMHSCKDGGTKIFKYRGFKAALHSKRPARQPSQWVHLKLLRMVTWKQSISGWFLHHNLALLHHSCSITLKTQGNACDVTDCDYFQLAQGQKSALF